MEMKSLYGPVQTVDSMSAIHPVETINMMPVSTVLIEVCLLTLLSTFSIAIAGNMLCDLVIGYSLIFMDLIVSRFETTVSLI